MHPFARLTAAAITLVVAALTGCSGGGDPDPPPAPASPVARDVDKVAATDASRDSLVRLDGEQGARSELTDFVCEPTGGVWKARGTLNNPTDQDTTYYLRIGVHLDEGSHSSVAMKNVFVDVPAGDTKSFADETIVTTDEPGLICLVRAVRGVKKG